MPRRKPESWDHVDWFTTGDIAGMIQASHEYVQQLFESGKLRGHTTEGGWRKISRESIVEYLAEKQIEIPGLWMKPTKRILLIDDDPNVGRIIQHQFRVHQVPIEVDVARSVEEGIAAISRAKPDLVLVDWVFPRAQMQGPDALKFLINAEAGRELKFIIISGRDPVETRAAARRAGASGFFEKGRSLEDLKDMIWPMLFARDLRGTDERRELMNEVVPR